MLDLQGNDWLEYLASHQVRVSPERDGIRVSFALFNTFDDVDQFADIIKRRGNADSRMSKAAETVD